MPRIRSANISQNILTGTLNVSTINVSTITLANGQDLAGTGNLAYNQANAARDQANSAYGQANDAYSQANSARSQANSAYSQANAAYLAANNANLLLGGVITGTLNVTQDIIVGGNIYLGGNTTYINVSTYSVEDSLIYLASNNSLTDSVDIGFVGAKNTSGTFSHTGLARDATDGKWKLFDGLPDSGHVGNVIDFNNSYLATLVANVEANTLSVVNGVSGNVNFDAGTLFVDSVGNRIGIGTTNPSYPLHTVSNQDSATYSVVTNSNSGTSAAASFAAHNGTAWLRLEMQGASYSGTGMRQANAGLVASDNMAANGLSIAAAAAAASIRFYTGGATSNDERMRITGTGNVSIGVSNTSQRLYVGITSTDLANGVLSSANSYPIARFMNHSSGSGIRGVELGAPTGGIDSPVYVKVADTSARFSILNNAGTEQLTVLNGGNVGIGTTNPTQKLVVNGISAVTGDAAPGGAGISMADFATGGYAWIQSFNSRPLYINPLGNNLIFNRDGGNIGIGTTSPGTKLDIASAQGSGLTMRYDATTAYRALITPYWNSGTDTRIDFAINSVANQTPSVYMSVGYNGGYVGISTTSPSRKLHVVGSGDTRILITDSATPSVLGYNLSVSHGSGSAGNFSIGHEGVGIRFTIDQSGNIGIGTTSPGYKLDVNGAIGSSSVAPLAFYGNGNGGTYTQTVVYANQNNTSGSTTNGIFIERGRLTDSGSGEIRSFVIGDRGGGIQFILNGSGNVGIGTTSPVDKLDVYGSIVIRDAYNLTWGGTYGVDIPTIVGMKGVSSYIGFYPSGTSFSEQVRITRNGSVGIGTTIIDFGKLHIRQTGITAAAISTGWPAYNAELATQSKYVLHLDAGGNGSVVAQGQGPSATLSLGGYYDSRGIITMIGAGGGSPSDQGNGYGKDLMVKGGNSDNGNGNVGGRLFLAGGSGYSGGAFNANYGQVVLQPQGGRVSIGTSSSVSRLKVDGTASVGPQGKLSLIGLDINSGDTPTYIKIITTIPFVSGGADFTVNIKGYVYGYGAVADLSICWHYYNSTFYNPTAISKGSWAPTVRLSAEGGFVAIVLSTPGYWPKLYVESMYSSSYADSYATGWTWVDANASGSPIVTLSYKSNFGNQFIMGSDGNVGIGTAPSTKLHVFGGDGITVDASGATDNNYLQCREAGVARFSIYENSDVVYLNSHNSMVFRANQLGGSGGVIRLDGGNVGIGTSPAGKLDVLGEIYVDGNKAIDRVSSVNAGVTYMVLGNGGSSGTAALSGYDLRTPTPQHFINGGMSFGFTSYDLNNTDTNGWADYIHFNSYTDSSGGSPNIFLINKASSGVKVARQTFNSSSNYNAGTIYTLNFTAASDGSVKEDVQNITGALDKIMQLRPVTFKWTDEYILNGMSRNSNEHTFDPETNQVIIPEEKTVNVGLIAQEVEAVIPTVVHQENVKLKGAENYLKNISYDKLVPHLIAALQELKREFDEYKQTHP